MGTKAKRKKKKDSKRNYSYRTTPSIHEKADAKAIREGSNLSKKIHELLVTYTDSK